MPDSAWLAVLPPLVAIGLALAFRRVALSLGVGVALAALLAAGGHPGRAVVHLVRSYAWPTLSDAGNLRILAFAFVLGGMIRLLSASGGAASMARWVTRYASSRRRGQLVAWALGIAFFFDDYANTLFVGSSMRAPSDRLRISREKLAFIVDATAAPVASLMPLSSWIVVEVGYIAGQLDGLGIAADAYTLFLETIPLRFYPAWMLMFGLLVALWDRDFGPMWQAEVRTRDMPLEEERVGDGEPSPHAAASAAATSVAAVRTEPSATEPVAIEPSATEAVAIEPAATEAVAIEPAATEPGRRAVPSGLALALAPMLVALGTILVGLVYDGYRGLAEARHAVAGELARARAAAQGASDADARHEAMEAIAQAQARLAALEPSPGNILSHATSSKVLLWAVIAGGVVALGMAVRSRHLSWRAAALAWLRGGREMGAVLSVLVLAWMLGAACRDLGTAQYLVGLLSDGFLPGLLPSLVFGLSALISFGTGTSFGTMGIVFPIAVPLTHAMVPGDHALLLGTVSSILAGSVFGDHCSPISDTTIMSAMASGCGPVEHVRTQLPYALLVAALSVVLGLLPVGLGWWSTGTALVGGSVALGGIVWLVGRPVGARVAQPAASPHVSREPS